MNEQKRTGEWSEKLHKAPFNVNRSISLPFVYIDPVVDVFDDPCNDPRSMPSNQEFRAFEKYTSELEKVFEIVPFDCAKMCKVSEATTVSLKFI